MSRLGTTLVVLPLAVAFGLMSLWLLQRRLIYFPVRAVPPLDAVLPGAEEVTFTTEDGVGLAGWFLGADESDAPTVLVFNGNAGNRADRVGLASALGHAGFSVLLFDYRGYGGNPGHPTETGLLRDARAAVRYLQNRGDVTPDRIVYFGESLGAGVATALAAETPPAALILRSPFTSLAAVGRVHYPWLPVGMLLKDRYPVRGHIAGLSVPLLVIAGENDGIVPLGQSRAVYEAAGSHKQLVVIEGADHNDPALAEGPELVGAVIRFLDEVIAD